MIDKLSLIKSEEMFAHAKTMHPGGVLGIRRPYNFIKGETPIFFKSGKGSKVIDVDGNEFLDMLCAYGPIVVGYREDEIDKAVIEQIQNNGVCFSLTQPIHNELSETLKKHIPCCETSVFLKTGSDATTAAIRAARSFTGKNKILRCGYHGWHDWCVESKGGIPKKNYEDILEFEYNDLDSLEKAIKEGGTDVAAIILTPISHPLGGKVEFPKKNFLENVRDICTTKGIVLIFDEIRTGFRVSMGGAQKIFNVTPDLACFGKALANGYPISVLAGKKEVMGSYEKKAFLSSTFFENGTDLVAAQTTINFLEKNNVLEDIKAKGDYLEKNINVFIKKYEGICEYSGGPWMPFFTFYENKTVNYKILRKKFFTNFLRNKIFIQTAHHSYLSFRHSYDDINHFLNIAESGLKDSISF